MKNLHINIAILLAFFSSITCAQKGELLITAQKSGNDIDIVFELLSEKSVAGVQFDLEMPKAQLQKLDVASCTSGFSDSGLAGCALNGNVLRVAVINNGLKDMKSGEVGRVTIKNAGGLLASKLKVSNAKVADSKGNEVEIKSVVDYNRVELVEIKLSGKEIK